MNYFVLLLLFSTSASAFDFGEQPAASNVQIGRVKLSCERHKVPASIWTDKIQDSGDRCRTLSADVKTAHEEYANLVKKAGEREAEVSASAVKSGTDTKSMIDSAKRMCESAAQEYDKAAKMARISADTLKEKFAANEKALAAMKKRMPELSEAERSRRVQIQRLQSAVNRSERATDATEIRNREESKSKIAVLEKEKQPIEKVLKEELYPRAIEEQGKLITSARAMEKLMREADRENTTKKADMLAKRDKLGAINLDSVGPDPGKEVSAIVTAKAPKTPAEQVSVWDRLKKIGSSDPVPEGISRKEGQAVSELRVTSDADPGSAAKSSEGKADLPKKPASGAAKLTEDLFDDVYESESVESKLAKEGGIHKDKVGSLDLDVNSETEKQVTDVNSKLSEVTAEKYKEDEEKLGPGGLHSKSAEVAKGVAEKNAQIEELAKNMPQDIHTGKLKEVEESSPFYEQQEKIKAAIKERNDYVAAECENTAVCATISDAGMKRTLTEEDISRKKTDNIAQAMLGERYTVKDGAKAAVEEFAAPGADTKVSEQSASRIASIEADAKKQSLRAEGVLALREHESVMSEKYAERGITPLGDGSHAVKLESQKLITDNSVAAGALNATTTSQKTRDDLGDSFRGAVERKEAYDVAEILPFGATAKAANSYDVYSRASVQANLLPESAIASEVKAETREAFEKDVTSAGVNAVTSAATGGAAGTITGGALTKGLASRAELMAGRTLEGSMARQVGSTAERITAQSTDDVASAVGRRNTDFAPQRASDLAVEDRILAADRRSTLPEPEGRSFVETKEIDQTSQAALEEAQRKRDNFFQDKAELTRQAEKIDRGYSETDALENFSSKEQKEITRLREKIATKEDKLESILEDHIPGKPVPQKMQKELLAASKQHADEIEKFMNVTGREGGEVVKLRAERDLAGNVTVPERYVYEMLPAENQALRPTGVAQHDTFLRNQPTYSVQFDPVKNAAMGSDAFQSKADQLVSLRSAKIDFSRRNSDVAMLHEGIHGRLDDAVASGKVVPFGGSFSSMKESVAVGPAGYSEYSSMEELATHRMAAKTASSAIREAAILRALDRPILPQVQSKLDMYGIDLKDISAEGQLTKDHRFLSLYRQHAQHDLDHVTALEETLERQGADGFKLSVGPDKKPTAVFTAKDNFTGEEIAQARIPIPNKEKFLSAEGKLINPQEMTEQLKSQLQTLRKSADDAVEEATKLSKNIDPGVLQLEENARKKSVFGWSNEGQKAIEDATVAGRKIAGRSPDLEYNKNPGGSIERPINRSAAAPKVNITKAPMPPVSSPKSLLSRISETAKNTPTILRTAFNSAVDSVRTTLFGAAAPVAGVVPAAAGQVSSGIASSLPASLGSSGVAGPATVLSQGPPSDIQLASSPNVKPDMTQPQASQRSNAITDIRSSGISGSSGRENADAAMMASPRVPGQSFPIESGNVAVSGNEGQRSPASLISLASVQNGPESGVSESSGYGLINSAMAADLSSNKANSSKQGLVSATRVDTGSGALTTKPAAKNLTALPTAVAQLPAPSPSDTKKIGFKNLSLKEKLMQELAANERTNQSSGSINHLSSSRTDIGAGGSAMGTVSALNGSDFGGHKLSGESASAASVRDTETSLFVRIRQKHIKYLDRAKLL